MLLDTDVLPAVTKRSPVTMFVAEGDALRQADEDEVCKKLNGSWQAESSAWCRTPSHHPLGNSGFTISRC